MGCGAVWLGIGERQLPAFEEGAGRGGRIQQPFDDKPGSWGLVCAVVFAGRPRDDKVGSVVVVCRRLVVAKGGYAHNRHSGPDASDVTRPRGRSRHTQPGQTHACAQIPPHPSPAATPRERQPAPNPLIASQSRKRRYPLASADSAQPRGQADTRTRGQADRRTGGHADRRTGGQRHGPDSWRGPAQPPQPHKPEPPPLDRTAHGHHRRGDDLRLHRVLGRHRRHDHGARGDL